MHVPEREVKKYLRSKVMNVPVDNPDMTKVLRRFRRALRARQGVSYCTA
jgi:hypothetical protein